MPDIQGTYRYRPITESQIRLLKLDSVPIDGTSAPELSGELPVFELTVGVSTSLNEAPDYDALSYTWGGTSKATETPFITIYEGPTSATAKRRKLGTILITANLDQALREFRADVTRNGLLLWVDAICIQQEGEGHGHEKGAQIRKMPDIFSQANMVRIWLGSDDVETSLESYQLIKEILALSNFNDLCSSTKYAPRWDIFIRLMQRAWFQRRWIVQEVAFASSATVYWGSQSVPWPEFASAVQLFASKKAELRAMFHRSSHANHNSTYMGEVEALAAAQLVTTLNLLFRTSKDGNKMEKLLSLETLLTNMTAFDVTRPHDTIYAIMQLSHNAIPVSIERDQSAPLSPEASTSAPQLGDPEITVTEPEPTVFDQALPPTRANGDSRRHDRSALEAPLENVISRGRTMGHRSSISVSSLYQGRASSADPFIAEARRRAEGARIPTRFRVDYDQSMFGLCNEIIKFCIEESKSIDIICRPWVPSITSVEIMSPNGDLQFPLHDEDKVTLPSWLCSVEKRPHEAVRMDPQNHDAFLHKLPQHYKLSRINADSLVGSGFTGSKTYSASGKMPISVSDICIENRIFKAKGFALTTIDRISDTATNAVIPGKWIKLTGISPKLDPLPDDFWRTLVGNRESSDATKPATQYWRQACDWVFSSHPNQNINVSEFIQNISGSVPDPVVDFLTRVRNVVWDKKLFRSSDEENDGLGLLGLAPDTAEKGDVICILFGCSVPLLLRPKDRTRATSRPRSRSLAVRIPIPAGRVSRRRQTANNENHHTQSSASVSSEPVGHSQSNTELPNQSDISPRSTIEGDIALVDEYSIIGECYLHGMMDGEAFAEQTRYQLPTKTFRLGCEVECTCPLCEGGII